MRQLPSAIKSQIFVRHIQNHLESAEYSLPRKLKGDGIPNNEVGCKICEKGIEQIYREERHDDRN